MNAHDLMGNFRDWQLAQDLSEELGRNGWRVEFDRQETGEWLAQLTCPWLTGRVLGRGASRVSAISAAHVESIRRLGVVDGVGVVFRPSVRFELVLS